MEGEYLTVEPEQCLVFTWRHIVADQAQASPESQVTVTFAAEGSKTNVSIKHEAIQALESRRNIGGGWNQCMVNLGEVLAA